MEDDVLFAWGWPLCFTVCDVTVSVSLSTIHSIARYCRYS